MPANSCGVAERRDERGSITLAAVVIAPAMIIIMGLAVDFGGQVHARQQVSQVAREAARAAGQHLEGAPAVRGRGLETDPTRAAAAARAYLAAADVQGSVAVRGGSVVTVTATTTYDTLLLNLIGIDRLQVSGHAQATTVRAVSGVER